MFFKKAQFKIQQMAFMLVAVFIFFTLVALFFLQMNLADLRSSAQNLEKEQAIAALSAWSEMPEFSCDDMSSYCLDEDKLYILGGENYISLYQNFWPIASIRVYKVNSDFSVLGEIKCPTLNCNYYDVYDSGQIEVQRYSTYVSICRTTRREGSVLRECELGILSIGMKTIPK